MFVVQHEFGWLRPPRALEVAPRVIIDHDAVFAEGVSRGRDVPMNLDIAVVPPDLDHLRVDCDLAAVDCHGGVTFVRSAGRPEVGWRHGTTANETDDHQRCCEHVSVIHCGSPWFTTILRLARLRRLIGAKGTLVQELVEPRRPRLLWGIAV